MGDGFVTRIARGATVPPEDISVTLDLLLGRATELTEQQLELAWEAYGEELVPTGPMCSRSSCTRPSSGR